MRRIVTIPLILLVGSLVLWEVVAQGTRTWTKYGILKQPLPSLTTLIPTSMIQSIIMLLTTTIVIVVLVVNVLRSRKIFGLIPLGDLVRHVVILGPTGSGKTTVAKAIIEAIIEKALRSGSAEQVVVIDWKGEYVLPMATVIRKIDNVWAIPGDNPRERALVAIEMVRETFNSLFRDHFSNGSTVEYVEVELSTPSFGITPVEPTGSLSNHMCALSTPSFGITVKCEDDPHTPSPVLSTPSFGITGSLRRSSIEVLYCRLSTPSFGITVVVGSSAGRGPATEDFQLPLSGSPSPIPGFSGSPRLSAAAPLRTIDS